MMAAASGVAVAASSERTGEDGAREPWGDLHGWRPGQNQTLCGLPLAKARLRRFPHVLWIDALWSVESAAEQARDVHVCPRCRAAIRRNRSKHPGWRRRSPRP